MDSNSKNIFDIPNEILANIFSYCDYYSKVQLKLVHSRFNEVVKSHCKLLLHLKNVSLDDDKFPLTMIKEFNQKYDKVIFENVKICRSSQHIILSNILQSASKISCIGVCDKDQFYNFFRILLNCDPGQKELELIANEFDIFTYTFLTDVLPQFKSVTYSKYGTGFTRSNECRSAMSRLLQLGTSLIYFEAPSIENNSHLLSTLHQANLNILAKSTEKYVYCFSNKSDHRLSFHDWNYYVQETKNLNLSSFYFMLYRYYYDAPHNIKELIKHHPNLRSFSFVCSKLAVKNTEGQSFPTPTINQTFNYLNKIVIDGAHQNFALSWLWFNNFPVLTELHLPANGFFALNKSTYLKSMFDALPNLLVLNIEEKAGMLWTLPILKYCPKLRHLRLCVGKIQTETFSLNSGESTDLIGLDITKCENISEELIRKIHTKIPKLQILNISSCNELTQKDLAIICSKLPELREIHMNHLSVDLVQYVMNQVQQLKHLQTIGAYPTKSDYMFISLAPTRSFRAPDSDDSDSSDEVGQVAETHITLKEIEKFFRTAKHSRCLLFDKKIYKTDILKDAEIQSAMANSLLRSNTKNNVKKRKLLN